MLWDCLAGQIPLSAGGVLDSYLWNCSRYGIYTGSSGYGGAEHLLTTSNGQTSAGMFKLIKPEPFGPSVMKQLSTFTFCQLAIAFQFNWVWSPRLNKVYSSLVYGYGIQFIKVRHHAEEVKEKGFNPEVQMGKEPFNMHGKWHLSHYSDQGPEVHQQIQM
uniref:Uncharacterized protein n=1 Tax=Salix viminalis TaxID=40686 RepID=A0A6N2KFX2_SALVM